MSDWRRGAYRSAGPPPPLCEALEPTVRLDITCHQCRRETTMTREAAIAAFGAQATLHDVRRRLRCTGCGERGRDRMIDARPNMSDVYDLMHQAGGKIGRTPAAG